MDAECCWSFLLCFILLLLSQNSPNDAASITIDGQKNLHPISPSLFGIFFEEINHAGVGGLYAEKIQNRAFANQVSSLDVKDSVTDSPQVSLSVYGKNDFFVRHCSSIGFTTRIHSLLDDSDSTFYMEPGLANSGSSFTSFRSNNYPDHYLVNSNGQLVLQTYSASTSFKNMATFQMLPGFADQKYVSFESYSNPGYYLFWNTTVAACTYLSPSFGLFFGKSDKSNAFNLSSTFYISSPNFSPLYPWRFVNSSAQGSIQLDTTNPLNSARNTSLLISIIQTSSPNGYVGAVNPGYWGISTTQNSDFSISLFVRCDSTFQTGNGKVEVQLQGIDGKIYGSYSVPSCSQNWQHYQGSILSSATDSQAQLAVLAYGTGKVWLNVVSLFPVRTFKNRVNGMRNDLAQKLVDLKPSFVRFPGGNYVYGQTNANAYHWKQTIGPNEVRPGHYDLWGYWSDDGLGFLEYLQFIEDIHADPIFVLPIGLSASDKLPIDQIDPLIQDALDAIEFATGPATSKWGSLRAKYGHPDPFTMHYIAIGNERCYNDDHLIYPPYYNKFAKAIRAQYPNLKLINNCADPSDRNKCSPVDLFDFHVYESPDWFIKNVNFFDHQDRNGPKVFVSEYAVANNDVRPGDLLAAVAEACWMIGMIRNGDVVEIASYAPLFINLGDDTWMPDMIIFNSSASAGIPSYYVQQMFSVYRGDQLLSSVGSSDLNNVVFASSLNSQNQEVYLYLANYGTENQTFTIELQNYVPNSRAKVHILHSTSPTDVNTLDNPTNVHTRTHTISVSSQFNYELPFYSVVILEFTQKNNL